MVSLKLMSISLMSVFVIQSNCAVTPSISTTNAPTIQKKSNIVYQFEPSDDNSTAEELDISTDSPNSAETSEITNESVS